MKLNKKHKGVIVDIICLLFILLFVYAACTKLMEYGKFRVQLGQSPLLTSVGGWVAWAVPVTELLIVLMLTIPVLRLPALYASFGLMTMFTTYIFVVLNYSPFVPCSCGGILEKMGWTEHLIFNSIFIVLAMTGILLLSPKKKKRSSTPHEPI